MATPNPLSLGEVKDGVQRYPLTGIKVLIAGAGIGGLLAALECYRKGHSVMVLERSSSQSTVGDIFGISPSAFASFKYYPSLVQDYRNSLHDPIISYYTWKGEFINKVEPEWRRAPVEDEMGKIGLTISRPDHAAMLIGQMERLSIPVL